MPGTVLSNLCKLAHSRFTVVTVTTLVHGRKTLWYTTVIPPMIT